MTTFTKDEERRIIESIAECASYIAKESPRNDATRPVDVQKYLDFVVEHRAKLVAWLAAGEM